MTAALVVLLLLVAVSTAALSAVNERELRRQRLDLEAMNRLDAQQRLELLPALGRVGGSAALAAAYARDRSSLSSVPIARRTSSRTA